MENRISKTIEYNRKEINPLKYIDIYQEIFDIQKENNTNINGSHLTSESIEIHLLFEESIIKSIWNDKSFSW